MNTVQDNKARFSTEDVKRAETARKLQHTAGHLSEGQLMKIARTNTLLNNPVTPRDVKNMRAIFFASVPGLKGKTVRKKKATVVSDLTPLPKEIRDNYKMYN